MAQLTLRTLLAYLDDTLEPAAARELGRQVAESEVARELIDRIRKVTRRRRLQTPDAAGAGEDVSDPNTVAEYLSNTLDAEPVQRLEQACFDSDVLLAEVAACHQILTVVLAEPVRVPPQARERMYRLVPPPAGVRNRRAPSTLPVVGGSRTPAAGDRPDNDDTDAALLLGMDRFGAGSAARRAGLVGVGVGFAALLAVAVYMATPARPPEAPPTAPAEYARATPAPAPRSVPEPAPKPPTPEPATKTPDPVPPPVEPMPIPPVKAKEPVVADPRADRLPVGKATQVNTLLVTRSDAPGAKWARLDPAGDGVVTSNDEVLCLPGYKADVKLDSGVGVSLWGNVPEIGPARLLDARARFHAPTPKLEGGGFEFDADVTLLAGRIYLTPAKGQERVRVRAAGEVYDFTLPDRSEVAVELVVAHEPGVSFLRTAGPPPRAEVKVAVIRGTAGVAAPLRGVKLDKVDAPAVLTWDSKAGGRPSNPTAIDKSNAYFDKFMLVPSDQGKGVQKALSEVAARLPDNDRVQILMTELVTEPPAPGRFYHGLVGIYGLAAVATSADDLKTLVDVLTDETRGYDRVAAAAALASWLARGADNTAALGAVLDVKVPGAGVADLVLKLLRVAVNPAAPDPADLDKLVDALGHPSVAVRELALWNLVTFVDPSALRVPGLTTDVGTPTGLPYDRFVKAWRARIEDIKKRPPMKK